MARLLYFPLEPKRGSGRLLYHISPADRSPRKASPEGRDPGGSNHCEILSIGRTAYVYSRDGMLSMDLKKKDTAQRSRKPPIP